MLGYLFWTISDNWEWADGYGPKFGLVAVDRANDLARNPRPSYYLFSKVINVKETGFSLKFSWYFSLFVNILHVRSLFNLAMIFT